MDKMYRLQDHNVRAGESPSDIIVQEIDATLSSSAANITTNFKSAAEVGYLMLKKDSTDADGVLAVAAAVPAASDDVKVLVFGKSRDLFSSF